MRVGTVSQVWRFPVKSMGGERIDVSALTRRGLPGDRGWAVFDETRQGITSAKRLPALRLCRARYLHEPVAGSAAPPVAITLPDGTELGSDESAVVARLVALLGRPVSLRALGPAGSGSPPRVSSVGEPPEAWRELMGLEPGEPMPDMSAFTPEMMRDLREGNFFDALPLHLLTRTTLRSLARLAPGSDWDPRRFRSNLLIEADDSSGYPELGWLGREVRIGTAVVQGVMGCPRCVMVTQACDHLPKDPGIMRTLVKEAKHTAGIYARVVVEGVVRTGDPVELLG